MRLFRNIILVVATVMAVSSCDFIYSLIHDDEVVAKLGRQMLYRSELDAYVPKGVSPEDSTAIARQYISLWAKELLFLDVAQTRLSKQEADVSGELEDYRRSLLKYRYEQRVVSERLDTVVTDDELASYYESHADMFRLEVPIVKARFLDIMPDSPNFQTLRKKLASSAPEDLAIVDSLSFISAIRYEDKSGEWVSMTDYSRNFGTDYGSVLAKLRPDGYIEIPDENSDLKIGYVCSILRAGKTAPLEYCQKRVRDIIISNRKHELLNTLEQELLDEALANEELIIY